MGTSAVSHAVYILFRVAQASRLWSDGRDARATHDAELPQRHTRLLPTLVVLALPWFGGACHYAGEATAPERSAPPPEVVVENWPNGQPRVRKEVAPGPDGTLVDHGTYTRWFDNGQKEYEATFVHGKPYGVARRWHRNGKIWIEEHYQHGKRHGTRCTWDESGQKRKEEHYEMGQPCGTWTVWDKGGHIKSQARRDDSAGQP